MLLLVFVLLKIPHIDGQELCFGSTRSQRAAFFGKLTNENFVLSGHNVATFEVKNFSQCFAKCKKECQCRSFNLPMSGAGSCELNDVDKTTTALKQKRGWRYHHVEAKVIREGSEDCQKYYKNGCCSSSPCRNGAQCIEHAGHGKPTFNCSCPKGFIGKLCQRKIRSCSDYLWQDNRHPSGQYNIWTDSGTKARVFCDMQHKIQEAWTMVMSHSLRQKHVLSSKPFYRDYPYNTANPLGETYRLSLSTMKSVAQGIDTNGSPEWRVTCDYSFERGSTTNSDVIRTRFQILDIMTLTTNEISLVGLYPFTGTTRGQDKSGYGNTASLYDVIFNENGPLGHHQGSLSLLGRTSSFVELNDYSGKLDTKYSLTIMLQVYPYDNGQGPYLDWGSEYCTASSCTSLSGVHLWQINGTLHFVTQNRVHPYPQNIGVVSNSGIEKNKWNYVAATYDYQTGTQSIYLDGKMLNSTQTSSTEIQTSRSFRLRIGKNYHVHDNRVFNGRIACLRIFNEALTEEEIASLMSNWSCPDKKPDPICNPVDYINIRGKECYDCSVWVTQTNTEAFTINAYRGDQSCSLKSGSKVINENHFGVYSNVNATTHACAASPTSKTQYWFGGRL